MKVAIVHDWLVVSGGAEKVLEQMIACFPQADIFSLVDFLEDRSIVHNKPVKTSFIQRLPYAKKKYRGYLPLMPLAIEQFDLSGYDLVLSSSHAVAKGVLVGPDQTHVSYVHSPIRYAWDLQHQYLREARLEHGPRSWAARMLLHYLRNWDARSANGVDRMIANSQFVVAPAKTEWSRSLFLSPGIRWAYNFKNGLQIVPGIGVPIGVGPSSGEKGVFLYLSFEHPMWKEGR